MALDSGESARVACKPSRPQANQGPPSANHDLRQTYPCSKGKREAFAHQLISMYLALGRLHTAEDLLERLRVADGENPYLIHQELGDVMTKVATVVRRNDQLESGLAKESYVVIPGSGTGDLQGLRGDGHSDVGHGLEHPFVLSYELG